ncbi:MAG: hypothetical protein WAU45_14005 [Blastocatellia bacterium]
MTSKSTDVDFKGPYERPLVELADLIEWLEAKHDKSFVKAGDDKVYAYGGDGFVLVFDETTWRGLIELSTPKGAVSIKQNGEGSLLVQGSSQDEKELANLLQDGVKGLRNYYENRYWATPHGA